MRLFFLLLCVLSIGISFLFRDLLLKDSLYYEAYGEQLSFERITKILEKREKYEWLIFITVPIAYLIRFLAIAACLMMGALTFNYKFSFVKLFQVAMLAEVVNFLPRLMTFFWFYFFVEDYTLKDLRNYYPHSLLALFDTTHLEFWWAYPIYLLNLVELSYWLLLAYGLKRITNRKFEDMLGFVASTYGVGLMLWVIFAIFLKVMAG